MKILIFGQTAEIVGTRKLETSLNVVMKKDKTNKISFNSTFQIVIKLELRGEHYDSNY